MKNVLVALSNSIKEVGYIQGLNSIVAVYVLQHFSEEEIYWILKYKIKKLKMIDLFSDGFPKLNFLTYALRNFLFNYNP